MLNIIFIIFISFLPIVFWWYIFSSMSETQDNRKRFFLWIFAGILSVGPILYLDKIVDFVRLSFLNFFKYSTNIISFINSLSFSFSLGIFIFLIVFLSFSLSIFLIKKREIFWVFLKNFLLFLLFWFLLWIIFYFLNIFSTHFQILNNNIWNNIYFKNILFNSLKLVIIYYILIAFIEETAKHFNFLWISVFSIKTVQDWVLYSIFVALWFSFIENILYFWSLYKDLWFNFELVQTYFFRSVFSLMLHVFTSSVIAYFFTKAYLNFKSKKYFQSIFIWILIAILLHFIFDFSLELGFNFVLILFFVIWYLYISSIFYKE